MLIEDHLGNKYKAIEEMCRAYDIPVYVFENRMKRNWTLALALETPAKAVKKYKDHYANVYKSVDEMVGAYQVPLDVVQHRLSQNLSLQEALERPVTKEEQANVPKASDILKGTMLEYLTKTKDEGANNRRGAKYE